MYYLEEAIISIQAVHKQKTININTSMPVLLIDGAKCKLAMLHAAPCKSRYANLTDGQTPDRYITLFTKRGCQHRIIVGNLRIFTHMVLPSAC